MTKANATHSDGKVESVAIHDFIKSNNARSRSRLSVSLAQDNPWWRSRGSLRLKRPMHLPSLLQGSLG